MEQILRLEYIIHHLDITSPEKSVAYYGQLATAIEKMNPRAYNITLGQTGGLGISSSNLVLVFNIERNIGDYLKDVQSMFEENIKPKLSKEGTYSLLKCLKEPLEDYFPQMKIGRDSNANP